MPIYQFKQVEQVERIITVSADDPVMAKRMAGTGGRNTTTSTIVAVTRDNTALDHCNHCAICGDSLTPEDRTLWPICERCDK